MAALILLFLFGTTAGIRGSDDSAAATVPADSGSKAGRAPVKPPGLGKAVRDGKFEFVVSRADCSRSKVGLQHLNRTAAGKYCVVSLSVKNIADRPQLFLGSAQKAFDAAGTTFRDDEIAGLYVNQDSQTFLRKIDPGHRVVGKIVFDIPKAATLTTVELHDSFFSGGVRVALR